MHAAGESLPNRLGRQREVQGEFWVFRFANGLVVHTDPFMSRDPGRILPLGGPQDVILNRLVSFPTTVAGKRVFDPFAGSGVLGLMALRLGAAHVDFLDVNPRAQTFQRENAARNGFPEQRYRALLQSIADFECEQPYDLVLANPPFVPTPPGIEGTLTSNGGAEGSSLIELLLARLDRILRPEGEAFIYVMQLVAGGRPLITTALAEQLEERTAEFTPVQAELIPFAVYAAAYQQLFPQHASEVARWQSDLETRFGAGLGIQHYVMHLQPKRPGPASWVVQDNLAAKYGEGFAYLAAANADLALGRVLENVVPKG
jgi:hypothetical protein